MEQRLSRRLQEHVCRLSGDSSFARAQEYLEQLLGVQVSEESARQTSHRHGRRMADWQPQDEASAEAFRQASGNVEFTVDAGKVNTLEEGWKDLKIAVFQKREPGTPLAVEDWDQQRLPEPTIRQARAAIAPAKTFRRRWRSWSRQLGVQQASEIHALADAAAWIWRSIDRVFTGSQQTLDIFHGAAQIAQAGEKIYGEGAAEGQAFLERGRQELLSKGWQGICDLAAQDYEKGDTPQRRLALEKMIGYFAKHTQRLNYRERLAQGQAIGSGAVEGQAKTLALRLKARGARWRKKNIRGMAALVCVRNSMQWSSYWHRAIAA